MYVYSTGMNFIVTKTRSIKEEIIFMRLNFFFKPQIYKEVIQCFLLLFFFLPLGLAFSFPFWKSKSYREEREMEEHMTKGVHFPFHKNCRKLLNSLMKKRSYKEYKNAEKLVDLEVGELGLDVYEDNIKLSQLTFTMTSTLPKTLKHFWYKFNLPRVTISRFSLLFPQ